MHSMMTGSVEDVLKGSNAPNQLCMDPELIQKIQFHVDNSMAGGNKECQRKVKGLK